jgi:hypothetical protein
VPTPHRFTGKPCASQSRAATALLRLPPFSFSVCRQGSSTPSLGHERLALRGPRQFLRRLVVKGRRPWIYLAHRNRIFFFLRHQLLRVFLHCHHVDPQAHRARRILFHSLQILGVFQLRRSFPEPLELHQEAYLRISLSRKALRLPRH